jgi:hypothetical protein
MIALVDALKPDKFTGVYFKRKKKGHGLIYCFGNPLGD